jgi:hypothetical protein
MTYLSITKLRTWNTDATPPPPPSTLIKLPSLRLESTQFFDLAQNVMIESMRWEGVQLAVSLYVDQSDHFSE